MGNTKPTPEQVLEHFKDAKQVRSLQFDKVTIVDLRTLDYGEYETLGFRKAYYLSGITVWTDTQGFAEIVSKKDSL